MMRRGLLLWSCLIAFSFAWNDNEHMMVAEIAHQLLLKWGHKDVVDLVNGIIQGTQGPEPPDNVVVDPTWQQTAIPGPARFGNKQAAGSDDMVSVAPWLDFITPRECQAWHFAPTGFDLRQNADMPERNDRLSSLLHPQGSFHAIEAVQAAIKHLNGDVVEGWSASFAMRLLIHVVGDLYQPMHHFTTNGGCCCWRIRDDSLTCGQCEVIVTDPFPGSGDGGGNLRWATIPGRETHSIYKRGETLQIGIATGAISMHDIWDAAGFLFGSDHELDADSRLRRAKEIMSNATVALEPLAPDSMQNWQQALLIADQVYPRDLMNLFLDADGKATTLPGKYLGTVQCLSQQQMLLAGLRLASELVILADNLKVPHSSSLMCLGLSKESARRTSPCSDGEHCNDDDGLALLEIKAAEKKHANVRLMQMGQLLRGSSAIEDVTQVGTDRSESSVASFADLEGKPCHVQTEVSPRLLGREPKIVVMRHFEIDAKAVVVNGCTPPANRFDTRENLCKVETVLTEEGEKHSYMAGVHLASLSCFVSKVYIYIPPPPGGTYINHTFSLMAQGYRQVTGQNLPPPIWVDRGPGDQKDMSPKLLAEVRSISGGSQKMKGDYLLLSNVAGANIETMDSLVYEEERMELGNLAKSGGVRFPSRQDLIDSWTNDKKGTSAYDQPRKWWGQWHYRGNALTVQCHDGLWNLGFVNLLEQPAIITPVALHSG